MPSSKKNNGKPIGLIAAAGNGTRIQPLPCSKELFPIGFHQGGKDGPLLAGRPKVVSHYLLESMHTAGAQKAYVVLNRNKWDIPSYFGPGDIAGLNIAYVVTNYPYGAPFSIKQACPFVPDATILFGFPDIVFDPPDALLKLFKYLNSGDADIVLGLFPTRNPSKMDMVDIDRQGRIVDIIIKPQRTHLKYTWILAAWRPTFTTFLQTYLDEIEQNLHREFQKNPSQEYYVGDVILAGMDAGLQIDYQMFEAGGFIDVGTPGDLKSAILQMTTKGGEYDHS